MIEQKIASRQCTLCQKIIRGRTDKKFCDDYCRNGFNNQLKSTTNNLVRNTNHALGKNRRILETLIPEGEEMVKTKKEKLLYLGYQFRYNTHFYVNKKGSIYYYCYDYGYLLLDNDWCVIVRSSAYQESLI